MLWAGFGWKSFNPQNVCVFWHIDSQISLLHLWCMYLLSAAARQNSRSFHRNWTGDLFRNICRGPAGRLADQVGAGAGCFNFLISQRKRIGSQWVIWRFLMRLRLRNLRIWQSKRWKQSQGQGVKLMSSSNVERPHFIHEPWLSHRGYHQSCRTRFGMMKIHLLDAQHNAYYISVWVCVFCRVGSFQMVPSLGAARGWKLYANWCPHVPTMFLSFMVQPCTTTKTQTMVCPYFLGSVRQPIDAHVNAQNR